MLIKDKLETQVDSIQEDWADADKVNEALAEIIEFEEVNSLPQGGFLAMIDTQAFFPYISLTKEQVLSIAHLLLWKMPLTPSFDNC